MTRYDPDRHHRRSIRLKGYDYAEAGAYFVTICTKGRVCLFGEIVNGDMQLNEFGKIVMATWADLPAHYAGVELDAFVVMPNHVHGIVVLTSGGLPRTDVDPGPMGAGFKPAPTHPADTPPADRPAGHPVDTRPADHPTRHPLPHGNPDPDPVGAGLKPALARPAHSPHPATPRDPGPAAVSKRHGLPEVVRGFKTFTARRINERRGSPGIAVWQRTYFEHVIRDQRSLDRIRRYIVENPMRWDLDSENAAREWLR